MRDMFNIKVKFVLLIVVTAKNCSCDDDEPTDIKATINILPLMNKISELKKTTIEENENSTTLVTPSPAASTISTTSSTSTTSRTEQKTKNITSEEVFGSIALKSTNLTSDFSAISSNETATASNTSDIIENTQQNSKVKHNELKNCPWITWFGIAFTFIIICWIIKCVSKCINKRNARKSDGIEPSDQIKSRIREAAIASASAHSVRKPLIQSTAEIHKSIKTTSTPKPRSKSPAKYPSKTL